MSKKSTNSIITGKEIFQNATGPVTIRLTNDYLFKKLLQENVQVLKSLICSLLHFSPDQVKDAIVTNPILDGDSINDKNVILDVNVVFNSGSRINLEMQVVNKHNWTDRATFYACRNFTDLNKGEDFPFVKPAFQIGFLDFVLFPEHPSFYATYKLYDIRTRHIFTDKFSIGIVDLTNISLATPDDQRYNIDKWARLFKAQTWEDIKMLAAQDISLSAAATTVYRLTEDEHIRQQCEAREDYLKQERGMSRLIKQQHEEIVICNQTIAEQKQALTEKDKEIAKLKSLLAEKTMTTDKLLP